MEETDVEVTQRMRLTCLSMAMGCSATVDEALDIAATFEHYVTTGETHRPSANVVPSLEVIDVDDLTQKNNIVDLFRGDK